MRLFAILMIAVSTPLAWAEPRLDALGDPLPTGAVAWLGTSRWGHGEDLQRVRFSPTGKYLVSIGSRYVRVWEWPNGKADGELAVEPAGHLGPVWTLAFSPDGSRLLTMSQNDCALIWDVSVLAAGRKQQSRD